METGQYSSSTPSPAEPSRRLWRQDRVPVPMVRGVGLFPAKGSNRLRQFLARTTLIEISAMRNIQGFPGPLT